MNADEIRNMPAGRAMNALIAEKILGWKWVKGILAFNLPCLISPERYQDYIAREGAWDTDEHGRLFGLFHDYSTDISAAWEVVEKLAEIPAAVCVQVDYRSYGNGYGCWVTKYPRVDKFIAVGSGETAPLAICQAALLAFIENQ